MIEFKFLLDSTEVIQPDNFNDFESVIKRDFNSHGAYYKFTGDESLGLTFSDSNAIDLIKTAEATGFNAQLFVTIQRRSNSYTAWQTIFFGEALFDTISENGNNITIDFQENTALTKLTANFDTVIDFNRGTSLEGNAITALTPITTDINNQRRNIYHDATEGANGDLAFRTINTSSGLPNFYMYWFWRNVTRTGLKQIQTTRTDDVNSVVLSDIPWRYECEEIGGDLNITGNIRFYMFVTDVGVNDITSVTWYMKARHEQSDGTEIVTETLASGTESGTSNFTFTLATTALTPTVINNVAVGERVVVYFQVFGDGLLDSMLIQLDLYESSELKFRLRTEKETFTRNTYKLFDVIKYLVSCISEVDTVSDFYDVGGCGDLYVVTSGEQLRGIDRPPQISLKSLLESLQAIHGVGWGMQRYYNDYRFRVELFDFFYEDVLLIDFGQVVDWEREVFEPLVFNTMEFGFQKFSDDENDENSQEEYSTKIGYTLPLPKVEGAYNKRSTLVASKNLIDVTLSKTDTTKRWKNDADVFIIKTLNNTDVETDSVFQSLGGLTDTDTAINARIAPFYMAANHAKIYNSTLFGFATSQTIQNTSRLVNRAFSARFNVYEDCLLGDQDRVLRQMAGNLTLSEGYDGERLFKPYIHKAKTALSDTQFTALVDRMEMKDGISNGFVTFTNINNETFNGYIMEAAWNPVTQIIEFSALEKYGV
jgi:hypothetical protein